MSHLRRPHLRKSREPSVDQPCPFALSGPYSPVVRRVDSDARGPGFEPQTGRVNGKFIPSLWRDKRPAIKCLRTPEHHAGEFRPDQKDSSESKKTKLRLVRPISPAARPQMKSGREKIQEHVHAGKMCCSCAEKCVFVRGHCLCNATCAMGLSTRITFNDDVFQVHLIYKARRKT